MTFVAWLMALVGPLVARIVIALGFSIVSFAGVQVLMASLISIAQNYWSAMPVAVLQLASLSGIPESLGMVLGAYVARIAVAITRSGYQYALKL